MSKPKQAVVIGGSSGIGLAAAGMFAEQGVLTTIVGRDRSKLDAAALKLGAAVRGEVADAADRKAVDALFRKVEAVDSLVIAASGGAGAGPFASLDLANVRRGFDGKVWVQLNVAQAALPYMTPEGSITFVTSASSRFANPGTAGLGGINGALERMVPTLARELAPLRVNAVSPGVTDTPWWSNKPAGLFESEASKAPLVRPGRSEEIADAILFLSRNRFVTGVVLDVDGGLHLT